MGLPCSQIRSIGFLEWIPGESQSLLRLSTYGESERLWYAKPPFTVIFGIVNDGQVLKLSRREFEAFAGIETDSCQLRVHQHWPNNSPHTYLIGELLVQHGLSKECVEFYCGRAYS